MTEINEMVRECLENQFAENVLENIDEIMTECVGLHYQIPLENYKEAKEKVIEIFVLLIRNKFIEIDEEYNDEIE